MAKKEFTAKKKAEGNEEGRKMSPLPTIMQPEVVSNTVTYQFELQFNSKAELVRINSPKDMSLEMVNNHLAVAMLHLATLLVAAEEKKLMGKVHD